MRCPADNVGVYVPVCKGPAFCGARQVERSGEQMKNKYLRGQSVVEYALLIAIVSAAFLAMAVYVRRAVQGSLYKIEDRVAAKPNEPFVPPVVVAVY